MLPGALARFGIEIELKLPNIQLGISVMEMNDKSTKDMTEEDPAKAVDGNDVMQAAPGLDHAAPDARVVPTPFSPQSVVMAASTFGILRKAFLDSVWTALGVLILTKLVSCG